MSQLLLIVKYSNTVISNNTVEMSVYPGYNEIEKKVENEANSSKIFNLFTV